jgi:hypothetical protein
MNRVFLTLASVLFLAFAATAQTTNSLSDAEVKGQQLAQQLCEIRPTENLTNAGILEIRSNGTSVTYPIEFKAIVFKTNWLSVYKVTLVHYDNDKNFGDENEIITVVHTEQATNFYKLQDRFIYGMKVNGQIGSIEPAGGSERIISNKRTMVPFGKSDFWIADLGLEFSHWPGQKVLKHETRRARACTVLESTNPDPSPGSYSHVDSWVDDETLGIVHAEAYDANGKLLKVFDPKSFKKVNGQWELQDMEIRNVQTGSRTWIKFDLSGKS